jgi:integrase
MAASPEAGSDKMKTLTLLTPLLLSGLKPRDKEYTLYDAQCEGLALRIQPSGSFSWVMWERHKKNTRRITLGTYPDLSPDEARQLFGQRKAGVTTTPVVKTRTLEFGTLCQRFLAEKKQSYKPKSLKSFTSYLNTQLLPAFANKRVDKITPANVAQWFQAYAQQSPGGANQALGHFTTIFNWGVSNGHLPFNLPNPAAPIRPNKMLARGRMLNSDKLRCLWQALSSPPPRCDQAANAIKLIILTGCRSGEIFGLTWEEVLPTKIQLKDAKQGPRPVMLSQPAIDLLKMLRIGNTSKYVFPSTLSESGHLTCVDASWVTIKSAARISPDIRIHDLRHTYASHAILSGETLSMTGKLLGHSSLKSTKRYAHLDPGLLAKNADLIARRIETMMKGGD